MSFDRDKVLELMGGEQKFDDAMDETFTEKIGDEGQLLFVPPDRGFNEFSDEDVDSNSKALLPGMEREMFSEERTRIKRMLESIFESLRDPSTPAETRLNPHCEISIDDEDIDAILESYLDGLED